MRMVTILLDITVLTVVLLSGLVSCSRGSDPDKLGLDRIDSMCEADTETAISMLDSIGVLPMREDERHRFDLLRIKANDKAYVRHTSDSLVLDVIGYYSRHKDTALWPEALYYGGRVYSDLGDYPTALGYFHQTLDALPSTPDNLEFRSVVLSQTGNLMDELRLFSQGVKYLEESIAISRQLGDKAGLASDCLRIAGIYIHLSEMDKAKKYLEESLRYSSQMSEAEKILAKSHHLAILYYSGQIDSAMKTIREWGLPDSVDPEYLSYPLAFAAKTYLEAGVTDTAYMYALRLTEGHDLGYQNVGYSLLFDPMLKNLIPKDSLESFSRKYAKSTENKLNTNQSEEAIVSASRYNYEKHDLNRKMAERTKDTVIIFLIIATTLCVITIMTMVYLMFKKKKIQTERDMSAEKIKSMATIHEREMAEMQTTQDSLEEKLNKEKEKSDILQTSIADTCLRPSLPPEGFSDLKSQMLENFREWESGQSKFSIDREVEKSEVYKELLDMIKNDKIITDLSFWDKLGTEVEKTSHDFKYRLRVITDWQLTNVDYQIALLIRCCISTGNSAVVLGIKKNSVSSRRSSLATKIFGTPAEVTHLDALIHFL